MRARHRHLNPGNAGASAAYDSRFGFSVADGTAISTWEDRTSNNNDASQATAANQPTYETNEVNGQPAIKFDGSNDRMTFARFDATEAWTICVLKRSGGTAFQQPLLVRQSSTNSDRLSLLINNNTDYGPVTVGSNANGGNWGKGGALRADEWRIVFAEWLGGGTNGAVYYRAHDDGAQITLTNTNGGVGAINANLNSSVGCGSNTTAFVNFWSGFMASVAFGLTLPSSSLRKRLTHAAGYSFKLACS
jgi:hypothetical protein